METQSADTSTDERVLAVVYKITEAPLSIPEGEVDLTYKVPSPVRGGTPAAYFSAPRYTGRVDWLVGGSEAPHRVFQTNMAYTAKVTVTAASGYTLGNPAVSFTHANAVTATAGNGTLTVTASFDRLLTVAAAPAGR
ncbi:MAG: hypothetical protein LBL19_00035 [Spirochaetaceae bacterium]|nr:hypothetical protein [Spirochaetaceae bacterium]